MITRPNVGEVVTVTTKAPFKEGIFSFPLPFNVYKGKVVASEPEDEPYSFRLLTSDNYMPVRVIRLSHIVGFGNVSPQEKKNFKPATPVVKEPEIVVLQEIVGSKGDKYQIQRIKGRSYSCTCPGFQFRKACKHMTAYLKDKKK